MAPFFGICTAFAYSKGEQVIYGRNNDLPPYLRNGSKSEIYAPLNGNKFNLTTSSFINGEEGFNEHGLAVAMTFVKTSLNKIQAGFNSCFVVRYLLEKADTTETAISLLKELPIASNCNILVADKSGEMVVIECTPTTKRIREAIYTNKGKIICTVNSFTSEEMKPFDMANLCVSMKTLILKRFGVPYYNMVHLPFSHFNPRICMISLCGFSGLD